MKPLDCQLLQIEAKANHIAGSSLNNVLMKSVKIRIIISHGYITYFVVVIYLQLLIS